MFGNVKGIDSEKYMEINIKFMWNHGADYIVDNENDRREHVDTDIGTKKTIPERIAGTRKTYERQYSSHQIQYKRC